MPVTKLEITSRAPFAGGITFGQGGSYEQLDGVAHFAADPEDQANQGITDLKLALRDSDGRVGFTADFRILRPVQSDAGNRRLLFDVLNRGRARALSYFNFAPDRAPNEPPDPGDGFLMRQGYTVAWCGWQHDVPETPGLMRIRVPEAMSTQGNGSSGPVSGRLAFTFQPGAASDTQLLADRMHRPYPSSHLESWEDTLTVQDFEEDQPRIVPREQWRFGRLQDGRFVPDARHIHLPSGFEPGKIYQLVYSTAGAPVIGLGFLSTRDLASFLRYGAAHEDNPCAGDIDYAYTFGASQSGGYLRRYLYLGVNQDLEDRTVFDGVISHIAGGRSRADLNQRFGQPSDAWSRMGGLFPFADIDQTDPETGETDGLLSNLAARGKLPKVFFTNTSAEYWRGHATLIHTDVTGARDLEPYDSTRIYHFAGTQHGAGSLPLTDGDATGPLGQQLFNCVDYRPLARAALVRMDRWVATGEAPPPSRHPRIDDGTAVPPEQVAPTFTAIPGVAFPSHLRRLFRLDFQPVDGVIGKLPPAVGKPYPNLVSAVDGDGNEVAGIRLPDLTAPLGTHTGWNLRHPNTGGPGQTIGLTGSTIPFPATQGDREATGDPRLSIEERYASKEDYLERVRAAAQELADEGYLLAEDVPVVVAHGAERYDALSDRALSSRVKEVQAADN